MQKDKNTLLADLKKFKALAADPTKNDNQRRIYTQTAENIQNLLDALEKEPTGNGTPPAALTPQQEANRAANQRRVLYAKERFKNFAGTPEVRRQDFLPATELATNQEGGITKLVAADPGVTRLIEIMWPGKPDPEALSFTEVCRYFNRVFSDLSGSWAARMRAYDRIPERSNTGWMRAVTYYRATFILSGEWLPANRVGVRDTAGIIRKTVFKMIVEHAKKIENAND